MAMLDCTVRTNNYGKSKIIEDSEIIGDSNLEMDKDNEWESEKSHFNMNIQFGSEQDRDTTLRDDLKQTAKKCEELAIRMEKKQFCKNKTINDSGISEEVSSDEQLKLVLKENSALKDELSKLSDMNVNWQKYNKQSQKYVSNLHRQISALRSQVRDLKDKGNSRDKEEPPCRDQFLVLQSSYENAVRYNCSLEKRLEETKAELDQVEKKHDDLKREFKTQVELSSMQIKSHKKDWQVEKAERNRMQALSEKLIKELQDERGTKINPNYSSTNSLNEASFWEIPGRNREHGEDSQPPSNSNRITNLPHEDLQCPSCLENFKISDHHLLLKHFNECHSRSQTR